MVWTKKDGSGNWGGAGGTGEPPRAFVARKSSAIGPMTIAMLLKNTLEGAQKEMQ